MSHPLLSRAHLEAALVSGLEILRDERAASIGHDQLAIDAGRWLDSLKHACRRVRLISYATRARIMERDDFRCRRCGAGPRDERLAVDHIVPVAAGGSDADDNLQTLCEPCNAGKGARPPHSHDLERR